MCPHDNVMHDSCDQDQTSFENDYNADESESVLAVATVPGDMTGKLKFSQSQIIHKLLLDENIVVIDGKDYLSILIDLDIKHQVLLRDGFSDTEKWGPEPYFYVKVIGPKSTIYGVTALLGTIFEQNAIGITHPLTRNDRKILNSNQGLPLPDDFHPYFTVSSKSSISRDKAIQIMQYVCNLFPNISGQLDTSGTSIEFHDFGSSSKCTCAELKDILSKYFHKTFKVETKFIKSSLLEKSEYKEALAKCDMRFSQMASCARLVHTHTTSFHRLVQKNARCCIL
jgi:hypothetical protein